MKTQTCQLGRRDAEKRKAPNWPLRITLWTLILAATAYVACLIVWENPGPYAPYVIAAGLVDIVCVGWAFCVGSSVGSFLNVVAWRVPRGMSINGRSHCPYCTTPIESRDNVPVLGWLNLRGRCRACRLPISPRYPIVELAVGLTLALVALAILYRAQHALPFGESAFQRTWPLHLGGWTPREFILLGYYMAAIAGLWSFGLVRIDGNRLPITLVICVSAIIIIPQLIWPDFQSVPWQLEMPHAEPRFVPPSWDRSAHDSQAWVDLPVWIGTSRYDAALSLACGGGLAAVLTSLVTLLGLNTVRQSPSARGQRFDIVIGWALVGMFSGWQTWLAALPWMIVVTLVLAATLSNQQRTGHDRAGYALLAVPIVYAWIILFWPQLMRWDAWPSPLHHRFWLGFWPTLGFVLAASLWRIYLRQDVERTEPEVATEESLVTPGRLEPNPASSK